MRKMIAKMLKYIPEEWGMINRDGKIVAFVRFTSINNDYSTYGDDADAYEEFEKDGFTLTKEVNNYTDGYKWLKENAEDSIGA